MLVFEGESRECFLEANIDNQSQNNYGIKVQTDKQAWCQYLDNVPFIWTGGRKCNFDGCDRPDLQPGLNLL